LTNFVKYCIKKWYQSGDDFYNYWIFQDFNNHSICGIVFAFPLNQVFNILKYKDRKSFAQSKPAERLGRRATGLMGVPGTPYVILGELRMVSPELPMSAEPPEDN